MLEANSSSLRVVTPGPNGAGSPRLLLVEDDYDFASMVGDLLEDSDHAVDHVSTLKDSLEPLATGSYAAALVDLSLPDAEGDSAWRAIRSSFPEIPIIVVTGSDDASSAIVLAGGAQDYVRKTDVTEDLLRKVIEYAVSRQETLSQIARARDEAAELALRHSVLARLGRLVSSTDTLRSVYDEIYSEMSRALEFDRVALHLIDWESGTFTVELIGGERSDLDSADLPHQVEGSKTLEVAKSDGPVVSTKHVIQSDTSERPGVLWAKEHGYESILGVPLIAHNTRLGALIIGSKSRNLETGASKEFAQDVADHMAGAIGLMQAHRKTVEVTHRQAVIARIGETLSSVNDLNEAFGSVSVEIAKLLSFDRIAMTLLSPSGEEFHQVLLHGDRSTAAKEREHFAVKGTLTELALKSRTGVIVSDDELRSMLGQREPLRRKILDEYSAFIVAPLISGNRSIGALHLNSKTPHRYDDRDLRLLRQIADHVAGTVAQFVTSREAREAADVQFSLAALGKALTESLDLETILVSSRPHIEALLPSEALAISLLNDDGETFRVRHLHGTSVNPEIAPRRPLKKSATLLAMRTMQALSLDEELAKSDDDKTLNIGELSARGIKSGLVVPLRVGDEAIGSLMWLDRMPGRFSGSTHDIAMTIASQIAGAIANAELYRRTSQLAKETEERLRLEDENAQLEAANEMKEQIISNVSHELRTPLTSILAFADVLNRNGHGNLNDDQLKQANIIRRGGRQLELIINDLLTVSRLNAGSFGLVLTEVSIDSLLDDVVRMMEPVVNGRSQQIVIESRIPGETATADSGRLAQILCNLVSNASKYSPEGSKIFIEAVRDGESLALSVTDEGGGVPEEMREAIFDRRYRIDNDTTRAQMGAGLGLHIAKSIVDAHKGSIYVEDGSPNGARFIAIIPPLG